MKDLRLGVLMALSVLVLTSVAMADSSGGDAPGMMGSERSAPEVKPSAVPQRPSSAASRPSSSMTGATETTTPSSGGTEAEVSKPVPQKRQQSGTAGGSMGESQDSMPIAAEPSGE